jgi:hypothetical protein
MLPNCDRRRRARIGRTATSAPTRLRQIREHGPALTRRADRVEAHILVCFLAYVLWKTLERWQSQAGLGESPRTLFDELRRIQSTDVVLPTTHAHELHLRCVERPDRAQAALLGRLGLSLPERVRPPRLLAQM